MGEATSRSYERSPLIPMPEISSFRKELGAELQEGIAAQESRTSLQQKDFYLRLQIVQEAELE